MANGVRYTQGKNNKQCSAFFMSALNFCIEKTRFLYYNIQGKESAAAQP
jgi:hypothetical protein